MKLDVTHIHLVKNVTDDEERREVPKWKRITLSILDSMEYKANDPKFRQKVLDLGNEIIQSTILLMIRDNKKEFKAHGTGVLYRNDFQYFIITAAHVKEKEQLFAASGNSVRMLGGRVKNGIPTDRNVDLCCFNIDLPTVEFLRKGYEFISKPKLHLAHDPQMFLKYLVVGFPARISDINVNEGKIKASARYYNLIMSKENVYNYYGLDRGTQYALDFKGKMENYSNHKKQKIGEPHGLSGSGLWIIVQKDDTLYNFDVRLIGIMTEYRSGKYHCLIGNKINIISAQLEDTGGTGFYTNKS